MQRQPPLFHRWWTLRVKHDAWRLSTKSQISLEPLPWDTSIQGTPPFRGQKFRSMNVDIFISAFVTFIKGTPLRGGGEGTLKVSLGRRVPPKLSKSPNPVEYKTAVDRFVLLWQLTEMHWWKQLSEDLTTEKVATVLIFFPSPREWPLRLQRDDFTLWQGWKHDRRDLRYWQND